MKQEELDYAYAAGLIDGEGCIGIYHNSHNGNYQLRIAVEMTDKSGLDVLESLFGGKWYFRAAKAPRKARYIWMTFNNNASKVLETLMPYLRVKKKQAEVALKGDWISYSKKKMPLHQQEIRIQLHFDMKELNKRGYYITEAI